MTRLVGLLQHFDLTNIWLLSNLLKTEFHLEVKDIVDNEVFLPICLLSKFQVLHYVSANIYMYNKETSILEVNLSKMMLVKRIQRNCPL